MHLERLRTHMEKYIISGPKFGVKNFRNESKFRVTLKDYNYSELHFVPRSGHSLSLSFIKINL